MIKTDIKLSPNYTVDDIRAALLSGLPLTENEIRDFIITRRSLNVKDKSNIHYDMTVALSLTPERERGLLHMRKKIRPHEIKKLDIPYVRCNNRPLVVGAGPAGLFAALVFAMAGTRPIIIERGKSVEERDISVNRFNTFGILDPESNIQYGEGGAGTFSDGKLKYGSVDEYKTFVLEELVFAGADDDILYSANAHVGTDKLKIAVKNLRKKIISLGGEFRFSTRLDSLIIRNDTALGARVSEHPSDSHRKNGSDKTDVRFEELQNTSKSTSYEIYSDHIILAIGHSARDTFRALRSQGIKMSARPFGIGMRVEHPREYINKVIYGENYPESIGTASYHLVTHLKNGRSVYSFCMCPGGEVVAASGSEGCVVTNGMSEHSRMAENSNAAYLVSVTPEDFESDDPLAGFLLQEKIEKSAFKLAGSNYRAPATRMEEFLEGRVPSRFIGVKPSYPIGVEIIPPESYLPEYVTQSIKSAMPDFDAWCPGILYPDSVLTGPETRTTSPVRIERDESFSASTRGLYPIGEGGGYSGGIISSAADGVKCAISVLLSLKQ